MLVNHPRTGKTMRLPRPYKFFADAREIVEEAYPGDIIGLPNNGHFAIGDTLCANNAFNFAPIPHFPPGHFARLINLDIGKHKQFSNGLQQLETEGAMQVFHEIEAQRRDPILAVLGTLQFDVVQARLENEYGVPTRLEMLPYQLARRVAGPPEHIERLPWRYSALRTQDRSGQLVAIFRTRHEFDFYSEQYPELDFWS
jgi:peptide chain release factor 3